MNGLRWLTKKVARRFGYRPVWFALRWRLGWLTVLWCAAFLTAASNTHSVGAAWSWAAAITWPVAGWLWLLSDRQKHRRQIELEATRWTAAAVAADAWPRLGTNQAMPATGLRVPALRGIQPSYGGNVNSSVALPDGMAYAEFEKHVPAIASWLKPKPLAVHCNRADDQRHAEITITRWRAFDKHTGPIEYIPGRGVAVLERGGDFAINFPGRHHLIVGQSDAGKSSWVNAIIAEALIAETRPQIWGIDFKLVELGPWDAALHRLAETAEEADTLIDDLLAEMTRRSETLRGNGRKWSPDCGFPPLLLVIDELAQVCHLPWPGEDKAAPAQRLAKLARVGSMGRSAGVQMILATQNPLADLIGRIRDNVQVTICCFVRGSKEAEVAIGGDYAASLRPQDISLQGVGWVVGKDRKPFIARARFLEDWDVEQIAAEHSGSPASQGARSGGTPSAHGAQKQSPWELP